MLRSGGNLERRVTSIERLEGAAGVYGGRGAAFGADTGHYWNLNRYSTGSNKTRHLPTELRDQFTLMNGPQFEELLKGRIDNVLS